MNKKGFTIVELSIVLFMVIFLVLAIHNRLQEDDKMRIYKQLSVISSNGVVIYKGDANWITTYTFGTGVKFYDRYGSYHEIEGSAIIKQMK